MSSLGPDNPCWPGSYAEGRLDGLRRWGLRSVYIPARMEQIKNILGREMDFEIPSVSETSELHPSRMLRLARHAAKRGSAGMFIGDLERLGRHPTEVMAQVSSLREKGARIFLKSDDARRQLIDLSVPALLTALSSLERRETARRTSKAVQTARARGSSSGRPLVMTPERQTIAARMLSQGRRGPQILDVIRAVDRSPISQSAYYLWQKAWLAADGENR
jgi:DNA invertase Pin-like site-specific DNA recombinase